MAGSEVIRSRSNPLVQRARAVVAGKERGFLALEGERLVEDAVRGGRACEVVLVAHDRREIADELAARRQKVQLVDAGILDVISGLETSPGVLGILATPASVDLASLRLDERTLLVVVAGIADPGNLGALSRASEAFGATALVVLAGSASPWNGKALRGSMGSLLRLPVSHGLDAAACARVLAARDVRQVGAATRGGSDPSRFDWRGPIALWVTGETGDVPEAAVRFERVTIPIATGVESLNVTVAAGVLLYAAGRAREGVRGRA